MPCASQHSTKKPAASAPYAKSATSGRRLAASVRATCLPISCGEIVPVFQHKRPIQELFHRNFGHDHPKLAVLGLTSDRSPRKRSIYYV